MLGGIIPILFTPFDAAGQIDAVGLRRILRFELEGGAHGIGINGFASEAYKLSDNEREQTVGIVAAELADAVPLVIGIAPSSRSTAIEQARRYAQYRPAALMALPPATMDNGEQALVEHYVALGQASEAPIMLQQAPQIPQYRHTELSAESLAEIARRAPAVRYFKIEGPGSAAKMRELAPMLPVDARMFGGGGGITALSELENGAAGLIPGVGFNEIFLATWAKWAVGDKAGAADSIAGGQALVQAVSGGGHEMSLHLRKQLMLRHGAIACAHVRLPTVPFDTAGLPEFFAVVDALDLRVARQAQ
ncbi:MAG: dihydrodipicolinate synthase family protein [Chloroflexi bacterium]|nr:dihydrodipicolinate synthase family protein [Chloroflexota bacterium]MCY4247091.1 dihydrodipicolinate synthase family protein [Chloroflexota bacterium]